MQRRVRKRRVNLPPTTARVGSIIIFVVIFITSPCSCGSRRAVVSWLVRFGVFPSKLKLGKSLTGEYKAHGCPGTSPLLVRLEAPQEC